MIKDEGRALVTVLLCLSYFESVSIFLSRTKQVAS